MGWPKLILHILMAFISLMIYVAITAGCSALPGLVTTTLTSVTRGVEAAPALRRGSPECQGCKRARLFTRQRALYMQQKCYQNTGSGKRLLCLIIR